MKIAWKYIAQAVEFYESVGFTYIEVPWIVDPKVVAVTLPEGHKPYDTVGGTLVGSAEQSFLALAVAGKLESGAYVAASPCFRDDTPDELHQNTFFKVELIDIRPISEPFGQYDVRKMARIARNFLVNLPCAWESQIVEYEHGFDIELNGIELGSYGYRQHGDWHWVYGTGLAEPRFSIATAKSQK